MPTHLSNRRTRRALSETLECRALFAAGATVPYVTYEAEAGTYTGALRGPSFAASTVQAESSGRQTVRLSAAGQFVQITAAADANSVVVRYSIPDSATGGGIDSTINLLVNGAV